MTTRKINDFVNKKIHATKQGLMNMISRFVLESSDDSKKIQEVKGTLFADETKEELEHFQNYGFTSRPPSGSEGVALSVNGNRDHVIIVCVDNREFRIKTLADGEVAVYNNTGSNIVLKNNGNIEINCPDNTLKINALDIELTQQNTTMNDFILTYNTHTHNETGSVTNQPNQTI